MGSPKEKSIPKIDAVAVTKVTSPKSVTLNLLVNIGVRRTGPRPWPRAPSKYTFPAMPNGINNLLNEVNVFFIFYFFEAVLRTDKETNLFEPVKRSFDLAKKKVADFLGFEPQPKISFNS